MKLLASYREVEYVFQKNQWLLLDKNAYVEYCDRNKGTEEHITDLGKQRTCRWFLLSAKILDTTHLICELALPADFPRDVYDSYTKLLELETRLCGTGRIAPERQRPSMFVTHEGTVVHRGFWSQATYKNDLINQKGTPSAPGTPRQPITGRKATTGGKLITFPRKLFQNLGNKCLYWDIRVPDLMNLEGDVALFPTDCFLCAGSHRICLGCMGQRGRLVGWMNWMNWIEETPNPLRPSIKHQCVFCPLCAGRDQFDISLRDPTIRAEEDRSLGPRRKDRFTWFVYTEGLTPAVRKSLKDVQCPLIREDKGEW